MNASYLNQASGSWSLWPQIQWNPLLQIHDPNPPITLEDPPWIFAQQPAFCCGTPQNVAGEFSPFVPGVARPFLATFSPAVIWLRPPIYAQQHVKSPPLFLTVPFFAQDTTPQQPEPKPRVPPWTNPLTWVPPVLPIPWFAQDTTPIQPEPKPRVPPWSDPKPFVAPVIPLAWFAQDTTPQQPEPKPRIPPWTNPLTEVPLPLPLLLWTVNWLPTCPPVIRVIGNVVGQTISPAPPTIATSIPGGTESRSLAIPRTLYVQAKAEPIPPAPTPLSFTWFPRSIPTVLSIPQNVVGTFLPTIGSPASPPGSKPAEFQSRPFVINRVFYAQQKAAPIPVPVPPPFLPWMQRTDPGPTPFPAHPRWSWLSTIQSTIPTFQTITPPPPAFVPVEDSGPDYLGTLAARVLSVQQHAEPIQELRPPFVRLFAPPPPPRPWAFIIPQPTQVFPTPAPPPPPVWEAFADPAPITQRARWSWLYLAQGKAEPIGATSEAAAVWIPYPEPPPPPRISFPWLAAVQHLHFAKPPLPPEWVPPPVIALPPPRPPFLFYTISWFSAPLPNVPAPPAPVWIPYPEPGRVAPQPRQWLFTVQNVTPRIGAVATFEHGKVVFWEVPGGPTFFKIPGIPGLFEIPGEGEITWVV